MNIKYKMIGFSVAFSILLAGALSAAGDPEKVAEYLELFGDQKEIDINHHCFSNIDAESLIEALKTNRTLVKVNLSGSKFKLDGIKAILNSFRYGNKNILDLNLAGITDFSFDGFGGGVLDFKGMLLANKTLKNINLSGMRLTEIDAQRIADGLSNNISLEGLNIAGNHLKPRGVKHFGDLLALNTRLSRLDLGNNDVGNFGVNHIIRGLQNNHMLKSLGLSRNYIYDIEAAGKLIDAIQESKSVEDVNLEGNQIGIENVRKIADILISSNQIKEP